MEKQKRSRVRRAAAEPLPPKKEDQPAPKKEYTQATTRSETPKLQTTTVESEEEDKFIDAEGPVVGVPSKKISVISDDHVPRGGHAG